MIIPKEVFCCWIIITGERGEREREKEKIYIKLASML
jgi:hypothetical protein